MSESTDAGILAHEPLKLGEVTLLFLPLFTVALGYGAVLPLLPSLLTRLHASGVHSGLPLHAGLLTALYIGAFVIGAPLWGRVTDRRGPRLVLVVGLVGYAVATVWFGFVTSLSAAYVARFVAGGFAAGLLPATSALIVRRCRGQDRTRHLAWVNAASVVGFLVGPALAGSIHDVLADSRGDLMNGATESALHLTAVPIWTVGVIALATALGVGLSAGLWRLHGPPPDPAAPPDATSATCARNSVLLLSALGAFGLGAFEVGLSLQSQRVWHWSPSDLAWLFTVCSLVMLLIQFALFVPLQRHARPVTLVAGGFAVMSAGFVFLADASLYGVVIALVAVIALGSGVLLPTLSVLTADQAGQEVGSAVGYQNAAANLGQAAGSAGVGFLFSAVPGASFTLVAIVMFVAAAVAGMRLQRLTASLAFQ